MMIAGIAEVKALSGHTQSNKKAIETAGKVELLFCVYIICGTMVCVLHIPSVEPL